MNPEDQNAQRLGKLVGGASSNLIATVALVFSLGTTAVSLWSSHKADIRANRREARELIQRLTRMEFEKFDIVQKNPNNVQLGNLMATLNSENILLAQQATELIRRYPKSFTSNEFYTVAVALSNASITTDLPFLLENALESANNSNDYTVATRSYATYLFQRGDAAAGREYYRKALRVWDTFPPDYPLMKAQFDIQTLVIWLNDEVRLRNWAEARTVLKMVKALVAAEPDPSLDPIKPQIEAAESEINLHAGQ